MKQVTPSRRASAGRCLATAAICQKCMERANTNLQLSRGFAGAFRPQFAAARARRVLQNAATDGAVTGIDAAPPQGSCERADGVPATLNSPLRECVREQPKSLLARRRSSLTSLHSRKFGIFFYRVGTGALSLSRKDFHSTLRHGLNPPVQAGGFFRALSGTLGGDVFRRHLHQFPGPAGRFTAKRLAAVVNELRKHLLRLRASPVAGGAGDHESLLLPAVKHAVEVVDGRNQNGRAVGERQSFVVHRPALVLFDRPDDDDIRPAPEASASLLAMEVWSPLSIGCATIPLLTLMLVDRHREAPGLDELAERRTTAAYSSGDSKNL